jgi:RES domain-containing protein
LIIPTTEIITQILSVNRGLVEVIDPIVQVEVKIQLVHVTASAVLAEVKVTTTFTVMLQVTHGSGHVLDPV